jgi:hypothetical protein
MDYSAVQQTMNQVETLFRALTTKFLIKLFGPFLGHTLVRIAWIKI